MRAIAVDLGDSLVNALPELPGANSAFQILWHCCGMLEWWTRQAILGMEVDRDRPAEFVAHGSVAELTARMDEVRAQLLADLPLMDLAATPLGHIEAEDLATPLGASVHGILLHVFEELAQHHGHLEITRDVVRAGS